MNKTLTIEEVRANLHQAIDQLGGATQVAARCHVTAPAVHEWKKRGNLNQVKAIHAVKFAQAAKRPLQDFILTENGR